MTLSVASLEAGINLCDKRLTTLQNKSKWTQEDCTNFHNDLDALRKMEKKILEGNVILRAKYGITEAKIKLLFSQLVHSLNLHVKEATSLVRDFSLKNVDELNKQLNKILLLCDVIRPNLSYASEEIRVEYTSRVAHIERVYKHARLLKERDLLNKEIENARTSNRLGQKKIAPEKLAHIQERIRALNTQSDVHRKPLFDLKSVTSSESFVTAQGE